MADDLALNVAHWAAVCALLASASVLVFAPFRIKSVYRAEVVIGLPGQDRNRKIALALSLLVCRLVALPYSSGSTPSAHAVHLAAALVLCLLSPLEHARALRPSIALTAYLLASLALDIASFVSRPTVSQYGLIPIAVEAALLVLECRSKKPLLKPEHAQFPPEALAGELQTALFWWINPLLFNGQTERLGLDDLPRLDGECASRGLRNKIVNAWVRRARPENKYTLLWTVLSCVQRPLLYTAPSRLALVFFRYTQPMLIKLAIGYVSQSTVDAQRAADGRCIIFITAVVYIGMALASSLYHHSLNRTKVIVRGSLINLLHIKVLSRRGADCKKENEKAAGFITTDVESLSNIAMMIHETWAHTLEVIVGLTMLARQIGWVSPVLLVSIFACSQVSRHVANNLGPRQRAWNEATQKRMAAVTEVTNQAKTIRMAGLTKSVHAMISRLREDEMQTSIFVRWILIYYNASANALGILSPALVFMLYAFLATRGVSGHSLDAKTAFTSTALLGMVTHPANMIMTILPRAVAAQVGFERIQAFLVDEDFPDTRTVSDKSNFQEKSTNEAAVRLEDLTIRFGPKSAPILQHVDLALPKARCTICVGQTSSGKSALVRAILGDMVLSAGSLSVSTPHLAVCMQTPWLPDGTLKDAVCGMSSSEKIDSAWYDTVIRACCLEKDLRSMPLSDLTQIGYCGMNLSGGQKQRIALARAVYSRCEIIILDDSLSALDRTTQNRILHNLLGPENGLFRRHGVTSLIMTNHVRHIAYADQAFLLEGSQLKPMEVGSVASHPVAQKPLQDGDGDHSSETHETLELLLEKESALKMNELVRGRKQNAVVASSDLRRKGGNISIYRYYFEASGIANCWLLATCAASYAFFSTIPQQWLKAWTDADGASTSYYISGYFLLSILAWIFTNGTIWTIHQKIELTSGAVLHNSLLGTTLGAASSFFFQTDTAETISRFGQDINMVDKELGPAFSALCNQICKLAMQVALLINVQWRLLAMVPLGAGVIFLVQKVYLEKSRQLRLLDLELRAGVYSSFIETTEGLVTIRAFGWEEAYGMKHCQNLDDCHRPYYTLMCLQRWLNVVMDLLAAGIAVVVVSFLLTYQGAANGSQVGVAFNMILIMNTTLLRLIESWTILEVTLGAISRLKQFQMDTPQEVPPSDEIEPAQSWPWAGAIIIENVEVAYNPKSTALDDYSIDIKSGQKVIITGRTGSGKSTLLLTLLRLLDPSSGSIKVDGVDLSKVPRHIVRERCFITLPQDAPVMPNLTLRLYVDPHRQYVDQQIVHILNDAKLWTYLSRAKNDADPNTLKLHDTSTARTTLDQPLASLPSLSAGQMQLLCVARAALHSATPALHSGGWPKPILLVDEATSSLDQEAEEVVLDMIERHFTRKGLTVVMVTHKLTTVAKGLRTGDMIVDMESGRAKKITTIK